MVATYRSTDANQKERLVHHQTGAQREMTRYSAYGVPIGLPVGDTNSDGDCEQAEQNQVRDWALATPAVCDWRGGWDLDGDVDLTDRDTLRDGYKGITLWRTKLSAVGNVRGCAGYLSAGLDFTVYLIRHRVFPSALGMWASRDPWESVAGLSLYDCGARKPSTGSASSPMS